jgi:phosphoesterase RecJ-like protein
MALTEIEQLKQAIEQSKHILLIFSNRDNGDAAASALAFKQFIEKQSKLADIVCGNFVTPKTLQFLPNIDEIKSTLANVQKFIIKVDVSKAPIESVSYDTDGATLSIYLTPKHGLIGKNELRTGQSTFKYDLIITFNTADRESLGNIFTNNTDLFYRTPTVVIDHLVTNDRYGQINLVDVTATSTSEVTYKIIKQLGEQYIDVPLATTILTGMTIATKSFKNPHITPTTLQIAGELLGYGADREQVVEHLYRNRSIATMKLWGEALSHLQVDIKFGLVWTTITREDFARSGGTPDDLRGIIDELISNSPDARTMLLLYEIENSSKKIGGLLATEKSNDALELLKPFTPEGTAHLASITITNKTLKEAEEITIATIRQNLSTKN